MELLHSEPSLQVICLVEVRHKVEVEVEVEVEAEVVLICEMEGAELLH